MTIHFTGKSGGGKTVCARMLCDALKEWAADELHEIWQYRMGATRNPVDDYAGEQVFVLNDIAGEKLDADTWKGLLDPHASAMVGTRYKNTLVASPVNLVTSIKSPQLFFDRMALASDEPIDQFLRRINAVVEVKSLRKAGEPDEKPGDNNTLVSVKTVYYLGEEGISPRYRKGESYAYYNMLCHIHTNHYAYKTPDGMDEWVKPSEAIAYLVKLVAKSYRRA